MGEFITVVGNKQRNPHRGSVDGIGPTITAACGMGGGMTPMLTDATIDECKTKEFYKQMRRSMQEKEKQKFTLPKELEGKKFRIRKLTPRECFRLQDVDDADIDKIQATGISNSSQYKLAGNSITVSPLYHIFRKLLVEKEPDVVKGEAVQLSLF